MHRSLQRVAVLTASAVIVLGGGAYALASSGVVGAATTATTTGVIHGCDKIKSTPPRIIWDVYTASTPTCPKGSFAISWNIQGPQGPAGPSGNTILNGAGAPSASLGNNGDFYLDTSDSTLYGPMANGAWPATGTSLVGPAGPQGPAGPGSTLSATATTTITGRDDSGAGPAQATCPGGATSYPCWALDTLNRTVTVVRHGAVSVSHCPATDGSNNAIAICYYYTANIHDTGSFTTDTFGSNPATSAYTPNQHSSKDSTSNGLIQGVVTGNIVGGTDVEFYAGSTNAKWDGAPDGTLVPGTASGDSQATSTWAELFFPQNTTASSASGALVFTSPNLINWSWVYTAPNTCETWTDAYNNGGGNQAGDGNIAGNNKCAA